MKNKNEMSLVKVTINNNYKDSILNQLSKKNIIYIKPKEKPKIREKSEENPLLEKIIIFRQNIETLFRNLKINRFDFLNLEFDENERIPFEVKDLHELINLTQEEINFYTNRFNELERYIAKATIELENLSTIKSSYEFLDNFNLMRESPTYFKQLKFKVYTTFSKNITNLKALFEFSEFPNLYQTYQISDDRIVFYIIYPEERENELIERINIIYAEEIPILRRYLTSEGIKFSRINREIDLIKNNLSKYQRELERIRDENLLKFAAIDEVVQNLEKYNWAERQFDQISTDRLTLKFFVLKNRKKEVIDEILKNFKEKTLVDSINISKKHPVLETEKFENILEEKKAKGKKEIKKEQSEIEAKDIDLRAQTPTIMRNVFFVRPFETITKMYGTPSYYEIDPTPFIAVTFPILFGLMFGDIGHGICLIIAGLIGAIKFREKKGSDFYNLCWIIFYCGWGSILGGALYGEFFGMQDVEIFGYVLLHLEPITIPILNITLYNPLDNIMTTFKFAVLLGVFHINLGWFIQALNYWKQDRKYLAFSDSFIKILLLTGGTILIFVFGFNIDIWFEYPYPILLPLVPGLLLIFLKPLGKVFRVSFLKEESYGGLIGEGSIETFETLLSAISNAASYIRLLALALAHISLMLAIKAMTDLIEGEGFLIMSIQLVGLIFGNLLVILLEGLLVFLNAMRLHFYEFFFKFFQGSGTEFIPFHLTSEYSIINFKMDIERDVITVDIEREIETKKTLEKINKAKKYISKKYL